MNFIYSNCGMKKYLHLNTNKTLHFNSATLDKFSCNLYWPLRIALWDRFVGRNFTQSPTSQKIPLTYITDRENELSKIFIIFSGFNCYLHGNKKIIVISIAWHLASFLNRGLDGTTRKWPI